LSLRPIMKKGHPKVTFMNRDRATDVWMRNADGGWQVIAVQVFPPGNRKV
jgi:ketosteroid isomerase-like protein